MNLESLQSRRAWLAGGAFLALLIVAASYFLVILPKLGDASDTRTQAGNNNVTNISLQARHSTLVRQQRSIGRLRTDLAAALKALPATSALPDLTHEVTQAATTTGVTLQNIGIGSLTAVTSAAAAPATPAATDSATTSTATPAATATPTATQYQVAVTLTTSGTTDRQIAFVKAIEDGPRRALVTATSYSGAGSKVSMTSQVSIFTAPMTDQQVAQLRKLLAAG